MACAPPCFRWLLVLLLLFFCLFLVLTHEDSFSSSRMSLRQSCRLRFPVLLQLGPLLLALQRVSRTLPSLAGLPVFLRMPS